MEEYTDTDKLQRLSKYLTILLNHAVNSGDLERYSETEEIVIVEVMPIIKSILEGRDVDKQA